MLNIILKWQFPEEKKTAIAFCFAVRGTCFKTVILTSINDKLKFVYLLTSFFPHPSRNGRRFQQLESAPREKDLWPLLWEVKKVFRVDLLHFLKLFECIILSLPQTDFSKQGMSVEQHLWGDLWSLGVHWRAKAQLVHRQGSQVSLRSAFRS